MKNTYENKDFFDAYAQMARSKYGLKAAREWHQLQPLIPPQTLNYTVCGLEEYSYPENTYDFVIPNLVLHYVADLDSVFIKIFHTLKKVESFCSIWSIRSLPLESMRDLLLGI